MRVEVSFLAPLDELAGTRSVVLQVEENTYDAFMRVLVSCFPRISDYLQGKQELYPLMLVRGKGVFGCGAPEIPLADGDKIVLFYALGGG